METTSILFWVIVPVLSEHKTVAEPSVSIAEDFLVNRFLLESRHAPIARNTERTTGNSSGNIAIAVASPFSNASTIFPRVIKNAKMTITLTPPPI